MRLVFLGAPGSGKGTLATALSRRLGIAHISTGDLFRQHLADNTELGQLAKGYMAEGKLVPDDVTIGMVKERLAQDDAKEGFIFDGFPRSEGQAVALDAMLKEVGIKLTAVVDLVVPEEELFRRITTRRVCTSCGTPFNVQTMKPKVEGICDVCGGTLIQREDDNEETLRKRLDVYYSQTAPLIDYYKEQGILVSINNVRKSGDGVDEVLDAIQNGQ